MSARVAGLALTAGRGSERSAGTAAALKTEVVIPDSAKDGTNLILATRCAGQFHDYSIVFRAGPEIKRNSLPIVGAAGRRQRVNQHCIVRRVNNGYQRRGAAGQLFGAQVTLEMILRVGRDHDRLGHGNSQSLVRRWIGVALSSDQPQSITVDAGRNDRAGADSTAAVARA